MHRLNVLFVMSREVIFFHGSGETEANTLRTGVQLTGANCDVAGLDSGDFADYESYFLFSLRKDVIDVLTKIDKNKCCVLFPQVENLDRNTCMHIMKLAGHLNKFWIVARTPEEHSLYSEIFGHKKVIYIDGWFLKPFIQSNETNNTIRPDIQTRPFGLAFIALDRDGGLDKFIKENLSNGIDVNVVTDKPREHAKLYDKYENVNFVKLYRYGCENWYLLLKNAEMFFEPNSRLTCSLLESLWLGKKVVSPHYKIINKMLGGEIVDASICSSSKQIEPISKATIKKMVFSRHANFVAYRILNIIHYGVK